MSQTITIVLDLAAEAHRARLSTVDSKGRFKGPALIHLHVIPSLKVFLNAFEAANPSSYWSLICCTNTKVETVGRTGEGIDLDAIMRMLDDRVKKAEVEEDAAPTTLASSEPKANPNISISKGISAGVTTAVCRINSYLNKNLPGGLANRKRKHETALSASASGADDGFTNLHKNSDEAKSQNNVIESRILVIQTGEDWMPHYNNLMNCAFAAKSAGVCVDALQLFCSSDKNEERSSMLSQLTHITGGLFMRPPTPAGQVHGALTQILLTVYLVNKSSRNVLSPVVVETVEFKGRCYETGNKIDIGFVCNLCLSVFERKLDTCLTCGSKV
ncbi:hypothetical protein TrST_g12649 [Triparma strigata]|uniref:RNA polymerase II transcription factor B subunit 4 n=1 Tax=Triparma strigata TaxID=1606541 RepID=A0A9W7C151_9STRA|nr:hypothetical protein TrST_g12649 [Triparma strigata]